MIISENNLICEGEHEMNDTDPFEPNSPSSQDNTKDAFNQDKLPLFISSIITDPHLI